MKYLLLLCVLNSAYMNASQRKIVTVKRKPARIADSSSPTFYDKNEMRLMLRTQLLAPVDLGGSQKPIFTKEHALEFDGLQLLMETMGALLGVHGQRHLYLRTATGFLLRHSSPMSNSIPNILRTPYGELIYNVNTKDVVALQKKLEAALVTKSIILPGTNEQAREIAFIPNEGGMRIMPQVSLLTSTQDPNKLPSDVHERFNALMEYKMRGRGCTIQLRDQEDPSAYKNGAPIMLSLSKQGQALSSSSMEIDSKERLSGKKRKPKQEAPIVPPAAKRQKLTDDKTSRENSETIFDFLKKGNKT